MNHQDTKTTALSNRRGLTRIEVVVVGAVVIVLTAIVLPGIQSARETARSTECRNNLKEIGISLYNYHDAHRMYPAGALSWSQFPDLKVAANVGLQPYLGGSTNMRWYPGDCSWKDEESWWATVVISYFVCPSHTREGLTRDDFLGSHRRELDNTFATTTYIFCKGAGDAWCTSPESIPRNQRGAFDVDAWITNDDVSDGLSSTIFVGEGATGDPWHVCAGAGCTTPVENPLTGSWYLPDQPYFIPYINTDKDIDKAGPRASLFGSTREPMNKNPVTDTLIDSSALSDCRSSAEGGPHRTSNFRSNHAGGGNFLFGDGSVQFLSDDIDMRLYRSLSTIAGGEQVD